MFESVEIFRDIHKGKIGYILGAGYSLNYYDLEKISEDGGIIFTCNSTILSVKKSNYHVIVDGTIPYFNFYIDIATNAENVIFAGTGIDKKYYYNDIDGYGEKIKFNGKKYLINRRYHPNGTWFVNNNLPNAANFQYRDNNLIDGADVCMVAAHLAHICGCVEIILIGVDLVNNNERYFKKISDEKILQKKESPYKYIDDPSIINNNDCNVRAYNAWIKIKKENDNLNIKNTNKDGLLSNLWETIDLKKYEKI